jgi:hypothetical protein
LVERYLRKRSRLSKQILNSFIIAAKINRSRILSAAGRFEYGRAESDRARRD